MHWTPVQFIDGHSVMWSVVVVTRLAPCVMRHSRAAARQFARQPARAVLGIASTRASAASPRATSAYRVRVGTRVREDAATLQRVMGQQAS